MEQNKFLKIFSIFSFIAFAAVSCWATVESLHLLLPSIPIVFVWIITVGFFFIASWGSKMIVDSFNSSIYLEHRRMHLFGGILIMLVFWLVCSLPTNTHTFFYRAVVRDVAIEDLTQTQSYLRALANDELAQDKIRHEWATYEQEVWNIFDEIRNETMNPSRLGIGERVENLLIKLDAKLSSQGSQIKLGRVQPKSQGIKGWNEVLNIYKSNIENTLERQKADYALRHATITDDKVKKQLNTHLANIDIVLNDIHNMHSIEQDKIDNANTVLTESYSIINTYSDQLKLKDKTQHGVNQITRLTSVIDTWKDFIKGEFAGRGFIFWVIISALVDIAGFVFFDIAFSRKN